MPAAVAHKDARGNGRLRGVRQEARAASAGIGRPAESRAGKKRRRWWISAQSGAPRRFTASARRWTPVGEGSRAGLFAALAVPLANHSLALLSLAISIVVKRRGWRSRFRAMPAVSPLSACAEFQLGDHLDAADRSDERSDSERRHRGGWPRISKPSCARQYLSGRKSSPTASNLLQGIDVLPQGNDKPTDLLLFRGICEERPNNEQAETDMRRRRTFSPRTEC